MPALLTYLGTIAMRLGLPDGDVVVRPGRQVQVPDSSAPALVATGKFRAVGGSDRMMRSPEPSPMAGMAFSASSVATIQGWNLAAFAEVDLLDALAADERVTVQRLLRAELERRGAL
jgi:hypothetical protein